MLRRYYLIVFLFLLTNQFIKSQILFTASLDGIQETPNPIMTAASGTAWAVLNPDTKSITYSVTYANLSTPFKAAHFHVGPVGVGGNVVFPLNFIGNTAKGTWDNIPDSILAKLFTGQLYVNVHSDANPGGEIRGQFNYVDGIGFTSSIDGSQETPLPISTNGSGTGFAIIENDGTQISYRFTVAGLSSTVTAAHFHYSPIGVGGSPIQAINFGTDSTATGMWTGYPDSILVQFLKNNMYFNIHTTNNPGGEMRGQMLHKGEVLFTANLDGSQETPMPITTTGKGTGWAVLRNDNNSLYYRETFAQLSSPFKAGHIHVGAPGVTGNVIEPFNFIGNSAEGVYTNIPDSLVAQFIKGNTYLNVHTNANPGGEIRGQLKLSTGIGFVTVLDGLQETPPVTTDAKGTGYFIWGASKDTLNYQITVAGLSSALIASHFHTAPAGVPGNVTQKITFGPDSTVNSFWAAPSDSSIINLVHGNIYANVHTTNNGSGEIRGQLIFTNVLSGNLVGVKDQVSNIPSNYILNQNYPNPFNPSTTISYTLPNVSRVKLAVFDILGRQVDVLENQIKPAGSYKITWTPRNLASGVYFYRLEAGSFISTKKLLLLK